MSTLPTIPSPPTYTQTTEKRRWPVILSLIFFFPIGLWLLWRSKNFSKRAKIVWTCIVGGLVLFGAMQDSLKDKRGSASETGCQSSSTNAGLLAKRQSETQERLEKILRAVLGTDLLDVNLTALAGDGSSFSALVSFNAARGLGAQNTSHWIEGKMAEAYRAVYTSDVNNVIDVGIDAHCNNRVIRKLQFASDEDLIVYQTRLERDAGSKVDWARASELDFTKIWETDLSYRDFLNLGKYQ